MSEFEMIFWIMYAPYLIIGIPIVVIMTILVFKWIKEDKEWYAYNDAYKQWDKEGRKGNMPQYKNFKSKNKH